MNRILLSLLLLICHFSCRREILLSLGSARNEQVIALQPLNGYAGEGLESLREELAGFYSKKVIILPSLQLPVSFLDTILRKYSSDSILVLLSGKANDSIVEVIGIIHEPVFAIKQDGAKHRYFDESIFGIGHQPGHACLVSDSRLATGDERLLVTRLQNVVVHEVGHNMGLGHCADPQCIMSESNGEFRSLDERGRGYCERCRKLLK
ncbi:MAG TPA: matrixin family metalloprotease [Chitinophagaceae bacterium]|nr:matrixin family metalloprotease [Chitinophagaceae bacterium]